MSREQEAIEACVQILADEWVREQEAWRQFLDSLDDVAASGPHYEWAAREVLIPLDHKALKWQPYEPKI